MKCSTSNIQLETVISRINDKTLNLQPDFQRGEVWSVAKQKKLIDTILRGWTIPPIHVVASEEADEVLDGQQRLVAIRDFFEGKFAIDGSILPKNDYIRELDGLTFSELPPKTKFRFNRYEISFITLTQFEPSEPAELFDRLNQPMKLTSAEQRNAYIGETRNQIKQLVEYFEKAGASRETIGFSNSRLAYDEIIAKYCYAIEIKTLRQKIVASDISEKYRENEKFSDSTIITCESILSKFMNIVNDYQPESYKLKMNKATLYSWFVFLKQNQTLSQKEFSTVLYSFEIMRDYIKGKTINNEYQELVVKKYKELRKKYPYIEIMFNLFNQRASIGSTDALSIIYRDIIIYLFSKLIFDDSNDEIMQEFDERAKSNVQEALEYIYTSHCWGENF